MRMPKRDKERSKRLTPKKTRPGGFRSLEMLGMALRWVAPHIEAAGSLDRAVRLRLFGGFGPAEMAQIKALVPVSRGGTLSDPDAEKGWVALVQEAAADSGTDMEELRKLCAEWEGHAGDQTQAKP